MKFIITGGNFNNKGAQAMTFIVCAELRKAFPECEVIMADTCYDGHLKDDNLLFSRIQDCLSTRMIIGGNIFEIIFARFIWLIKRIKKKSDLGLHDLNEAFTDCTAIFDVSGYAVGSNMSNKINLIYIYLLKIASKRSIPLYILPQSFGPLNFHGLMGRFINSAYNKYLKNVKMIFAREVQGKELLVSKYALNNVYNSWDIVLQNRELDYSLILKNVPQKDSATEDIPREYIGLIPSDNNYKFDNSDKVDGYYVDIIKYLLKKGERVLIAYHSGNDRAICKRIKGLFPDDDRVAFDDHEYAFYEFETLVKRFKFMISSRYHSIVLAYREKTPCIIFAWAIKYYELTSFFDQGDYILDMKSINNSMEINKKIEKMYKSYYRESNIIKDKLKKLEKNTCFDLVFENIR